MALSSAARRAIAIRNSVKRREMTASSTTVANDNQPRRVRTGRKPTKLLQACVDSAGFAEHAA